MDVDGEHDGCPGAERTSMKDQRALVHDFNEVEDIFCQPLPNLLGPHATKREGAGLSGRTTVYRRSCRRNKGNPVPF